MGDQDHGGALFAIEGEEEVEDGAAGGAVEIAGGFVGEEDRRAKGEGAGEGDALLFAAGELDGVVVEAAVESDAGQEFAGTATAAAVAGEFHRQQHILFGGERRDQVIALENEADFAAADLRHLVLGEVGDVFTIEDHLAGAGRVEAGEQAEQRALAAAGRTHDGGELAARNEQVDALEDIHAVSTGVDGLGEAANFDQTFIMAVGACMRAVWWIAVAAVLTGCSGKDEPGPRSAAPSPVPSTPPASTEQIDPRPAIVCFGDSITAGFGLEPGHAYPELLQKDLDGRKLKYRVVNMGVSGDTSQDGLGRMQLAIADKPAIVLLELGGNDGLRGIPIDITRNNLAQMIEAFQGAGAKVVLAGMTLPPNYGQQYIEQFEKVYKDLAAKYKVKLIPFLLEGVGGHTEFMQRDGLHPNAAGAQKVEALVMKSLEGLF